MFWKFLELLDIRGKHGLTGTYQNLRKPAATISQVSVSETGNLLTATTKILNVRGSSRAHANPYPPSLPLKGQMPKEQHKAP